MTAAQQRDASELAAPLDQLLIEATGSPLRGFIPDASTAKFVGKLLSQPGDTARQLGGLAGQLLKVARGQSTLAPARGDRRFTDPAWTQNAMLHRLVQAYLAAGHTADELLDQAALGWRDNRRVRFLVQNLVEALSPSNMPLLNPASAKEAIDTGGASFVRGARSLVNDMRESPRVPEMVDGSDFEVGRNVAVTPGAVVFRSDVLELIQYRPQTERVRSVPLLVVPPTINKFYVVDLAPGRSIMEHLVQSGQQAFIISWRNPDAAHADWGLDTYVAAVIEALDAVEQITGSDRTVLTGICSGGIIASVAAAVLAGTGQLARLAGFTLLVTVLDNTRVGDIGALQTRQLAEAATAVSRARGYLDGRTLAELFAWLRPGDLIWNYWVNNYLLGRRPPAFDVLYWNSDTTRMAAQLHADFVNLAMENQLVEPGALKIGEVPINLSTVDLDSYIVAGVADHITPWQNCYRSTALLGGDCRFVLSRSGHIAALVNPPGNPKATFQLNPDNADGPADWLAGATTNEGSWWTDWVGWLAKHSGRQKAAPKALGGGGLEPLADAPGTYVHEK